MSATFTRTVELSTGLSYRRVDDFARRVFTRPRLLNEDRTDFLRLATRIRIDVLREPEQLQLLVDGCQRLLEDILLLDCFVRSIDSPDEGIL